MSARVKKSGAACGPSVTPISQSLTIAGRRSARRLRRLPERRLGARAQHVPCLQGAAAVAAEPAQGERRGAAQVLGHVETAAHGEVSAQAWPRDRADRQDGAGGHGDRRPPRDRRLAEPRHPQHRVRRRAAQADERVVRELEGRPGRGDLKGGRALGIADGEVGLTERHLVHRPARRHADPPVAKPPRPVLHRRQRARREHVDPRLRVGHPVQGGRRVRDGPHVGPGRDGPEQAEVGRDAVDAGHRQRAGERRQGGVPVSAAGDDLRDHRVVVR